MNQEIYETQFEFLSETMERPKNFIRRFSKNGKRFYFKIGENNIPKIYSSATTLIKDGYAEDTIFLEEWRNKLVAKGINPSDELAYLATRGTLLHILAGDYIQHKEINFNLDTYFKENHPDALLEPFYNKVIEKDSLWLQKGIMAFAVFCEDYKVKPLAIELILCSDKYSVASPIDLICEMEITEDAWEDTGEVFKSGPRKGEPKPPKKVKVSRRVVAIVDLKSSENGFQDKHFFQLQLYKRILKENYPNLEVERLYNWSPKAWRTEPSYNLKEQSDGRLEKLCESVFEQGRIKHENKEPMIDVVPMTIKMGSEFSYEKVSLSEYLQKEFTGGKRTSENK